MQLIGPYLVILVGIVVIGAGALLCAAIGLIGIGICEGAAWIRETLAGPHARMKRS